MLEDQHLHLKQPEVWESKWCSRITALARKESQRQSVRCVLEVYGLSKSDSNGTGTGMVNMFSIQCCFLCHCFINRTG